MIISKKENEIYTKERKYVKRKLIPLTGIHIYIYHDNKNNNITNNMILKNYKDILLKHK